MIIQTAEHVGGLEDVFETSRLNAMEMTFEMTVRGNEILDKASSITYLEASMSPKEVIEAFWHKLSLRGVRNGLRYYRAGRYHELARVWEPIEEAK